MGAEWWVNVWIARWAASDQSLHQTDQRLHKLQMRDKELT